MSAYLCCSSPWWSWSMRYNGGDAIVGIQQVWRWFLHVLIAINVFNWYSVSATTSVCTSLLMKIISRRRRSENVGVGVTGRKGKELSAEYCSDQHSATYCRARNVSYHWGGGRTDWLTDGGQRSRSVLMYRYACGWRGRTGTGGRPTRDRPPIGVGL